METQQEPMHSQEPQISAFEEIKSMDYDKAINVLIQASNLAQQAGALTIRDSILLGAAIELVNSEKK